MTSFYIRALLVLMGVPLGGMVLLGIGYGASRLIKPAWPPDYHATAAIAWMSVAMIVGAGISAMVTKRRTQD